MQLENRLQVLFNRTMAQVSTWASRADLTVLMTIPSVASPFQLFTLSTPLSFTAAGPLRLPHWPHSRDGTVPG